jgi:hypothetical protein
LSDQGSGARDARGPGPFSFIAKNSHQRHFGPIARCAKHHKPAKTKGQVWATACASRGHADFNGHGLMDPIRLPPFPLFHDTKRHVL